jgi:GTP-binding protein
MRFVDVPGYGYAKVSKADREAFATMIDTYLTTREQLELVIQLVDARHDPSKDDIQMLEYLRSYEIPTIVIATKIDKVPVTKRPAREKAIRQVLDLSPEEFLTFSATEGIHLDLVHDLIAQVEEATR